MDKVLDKLKAARTTLRTAQTKHRENHDKCFRDALEEKEKEIKNADDPKKAKKAAAAIESLIRKHQASCPSKFRWRSSTSGSPQERR
jgi:hypothetical protein